MARRAAARIQLLASSTSPTFKAQAFLLHSICMGIAEQILAECAIATRLISLWSSCYNNTSCCCHKTNDMSSITFRATKAFWPLLGKTLDDRRVRARQILLAWDGIVRDFPLHWRGEEQELSLKLDSELSSLQSRLRAKGIARTVALFSAATQAGLHETDAAPSHHVTLVAVSATKPRSSARPHAANADKAAPAGEPDETCGDLWSFDKTPYTEEQAAILLGKIRALRARAIEQLRNVHAYAFDLDRATGDEADITTHALLSQHQEAALRQARAMLAETDAALARLREGTYGWCEETGEAIEYRRMLANPLARLSLEAQERLEARQRLRREVA